MNEQALKLQSEILELTKQREDIQRTIEKKKDELYALTIVSTPAKKTGNKTTFMKKVLSYRLIG